MAKKTLIAAVILANPKTGQPETFLPGADVPGWASKLITNPSAWGEEAGGRPASGSRKSSAPAGDKQPEEIESDGAGDDQDETVPEEIESDGAGDDQDETVEGVPAAAEPTPDSDWRVPQLREYADTHGIDLTGASLKADILDRIADHLAR